jgi:uncharacterized SAM-binding protein YcdF (DUF218 family)
VKRVLPLFLVLLLVVGAGYVESSSFSSLWRRFLVVNHPLEKADAIIVLGGEAAARPQEAARLFHQGVAPRVFVTGIGDAGRNRSALLAGGVPKEAITLETKARTTHANAMNLRPLLESAHLRSAVIVTSPFHTRRALATFRSVIPAMSFGIVPASLPWWDEPRGRGELNRYAFVEFLKILEYRLLYGISAWNGAAALESGVR